MPTDNELKNDDSEHELRVLQGVIEQLNKFSNRIEIVTIINLFNKLLEKQQVDLGSLRTRILTIYNDENIHYRWYDKQFYNALFSLLLLLAKYNPPASNRNNDGELECPITYEPINPSDRLLTIHGIHFDRESLETWIKDKNNVTNPAVQRPFSQRELNYLRARINNLTPEIPFLEQAIPEPPLPRLSALQSIKKKIKNYMARHPGVLCGLCICGIVGIMAGLFALLFLMPFVNVPPLAGLFVSGAAFIGISCCMHILSKVKKLYLSLSQIPNTEPVVLKKNEIRPFIKIEQSELLLHAFKDQDQLPYSTQQIQHSLQVLPKNNDFLKKVEQEVKTCVALPIIHSSELQPTQQIRSKL